MRSEVQGWEFGIEDLEKQRRQTQLEWRHQRDTLSKVSPKNISKSTFPMSFSSFLLSFLYQKHKTVTMIFGHGIKQNSHILLE